MRYILIITIFILASCNNSDKELLDFHGISIYPKSRFIEKYDDKSFTDTATFTAVSKDNESKVIAYYIKSLGKPRSLKKIDHRTNLYYKKHLDYPDLENINILISTELDGTEINIILKILSYVKK